MRVVKFFINEFHKNNVSNISFIASPSFTFTVNGGGAKNFEQCAQRVEFLNERTHFQICPPETKDDERFYSECEIKLPNEQGEFEEAFGKAEFVVKNGLLYALNARYYKSKNEYEEFSKLLENSHISFV